MHSYIKWYKKGDVGHQARWGQMWNPTFSDSVQFQILPEHERRVWLVATSLKKYEKDDEEKFALGARSLSVALNWLEIINSEDTSEKSFAKRKIPTIPGRSNWRLFWTLNWNKIQCTTEKRSQLLETLVGGFFKDHLILLRYSDFFLNFDLQWPTKIYIEYHFII